MSQESRQGTHEVIRIAYGEDQWQFGELRVPKTEGPHPVVIVVHGGFWYDKYGLDLMDAMSDDFTDRGLATWNIEYRRVGQEGGGWPGTLLDVAAAADYLRELAPTYNLDLNRVVTIGHSAGGHLSLWLAGRHRLPADSMLFNANPLQLHGVVSLAGVTDPALIQKLRPEHRGVADFLGGTQVEVPERFAAASPAQLLPLQVPQILIHGTEDDSVPLQLSTSYHESAVALGEDVQLVVLEGIEHFKVINPASEAWPPIVDALMQLVQTR